MEKLAYRIKILFISPQPGAMIGHLHCLLKTGPIFIPLSAVLLFLRNCYPKTVFSHSVNSAEAGRELVKTRMLMLRSLMLTARLRLVLSQELAISTQAVIRYWYPKFKVPGKLEQS